MELSSQQTTLHRIAATSALASLNHCRGTKHDTIVTFQRVVSTDRRAHDACACYAMSQHRSDARYERSYCSRKTIYRYCTRSRRSDRRPKRGLDRLSPRWSTVVLRRPHHGKASGTRGLRESIERPWNPTRVAFGCRRGWDDFASRRSEYPRARERRAWRLQLLLTRRAGYVSAASPVICCPITSMCISLVPS